MTYDEENDEWYEDGPRRPPPRRLQEELYYAEDYRIFMIACTLNSSSRERNHICVRPYHTLPPAVAENMRAGAKPWTKENEKDCQIAIQYNEDNLMLELTDGYSRVTSRFPVSELAAEVRADIIYKTTLRRDFTKGLSGYETIDPWEKYTKEAAPEPAKKPGALSL